MNWKRIGRVLLCLLVVCALIFNLSPIRAQALGVTTTAFLITVGAALVVAACFQGLGVMSGSDSGVFTSLVDDCVAHLNATGIAVDSMITMMAVGASATTGTPLKTYVDRDTLQAVLDWLFVEGVVAMAGAVDVKALYNGVELPVVPFDDTRNLAFITVYPDLNTYELLVFERWVPSDPSVYNSYRYTFVDGQDSWQYRSKKDSYYSNFSFAVYPLVWSSFDIYDNSGELIFAGSEPVYSTVSTTHDLTLGAVGTNVETDYETWTEEGIVSVDFGIQFEDDPDTDPDESKKNDILWFPTRIPNESTIDTNQTQEEAQTGDSNIEIDFENSTATDDLTIGNIQITDFWSGLGDALLSPLRWLGEFLINGIKTLFSLDGVNFWEALGNIITSPITLLGEFLIQGIEDIFVPREDFLTEKVQALREKFIFADQLITIITDLNFGTVTDPPIIYIDLTQARWGYNIGGKIPFIDLTWYKEYKPKVDPIISSLLWLVFIWRLFIKLPGIISGMPGEFISERLQPLGGTRTDSTPSRADRTVSRRDSII